jgi:hypothetical protein
MNSELARLREQLLGVREILAATRGVTKDLEDARALKVAQIDAWLVSLPEVDQ